MGNHYSLGHIELVFVFMDVGVERMTLAEAGHNGQSGRFHACPHEQHQVLMAGLAECAHLYTKVSNL